MWHVGLGRCIHNFDWENVKERGHVEDLAVDGKIILKRIL
jgi:hypothetical protein